MSCFQLSFGQDSIPKTPNIVQQAHNTKLKLEDFKNSNENHFKVSVFSVEESVTNKTHHWFIQVLTHENVYVNYGKVSFVHGHLKSDPNVEFKFMNPIVSLCNEGKYIIGFVNVSTAGVYELLLEIENFGVKDQINVTLTIGDNENNMQDSKDS